MVRDRAGCDGGMHASALREEARRRFEAGAAVWPDLDLAFEAFEAYFARHAAAAEAPRPTHTADMYLACACAYGVDGALSALEHSAGAEMARAVASIQTSPIFVDETLQAVRERLLVRHGDEPARIADYAGRASLKSWLCAVAVRWALTQLRRKSDRPHAMLVDKDDARLARGGPEVEYLRTQYKDAFEAAVRRAVGRLPSKQRMLLRLNVGEGMSVDKLASIYRVGRSTAARWLAAARLALFEDARRDLCATLRISRSELDSLAVDLRSDLEVSVLKLLQSSGDA